MSRPSRRIVIASCSVGAIILAIVFAVISRSSATAQTSPAPFGPDYLTGVARAPQPDTGIPAIHPHLPGSGPAFTAADARDYVTTHGLGGHMAVKGAINVTLVVFGTGAQIDRQESPINVGVGNDRLICYVEIHNTIIIGDPVTHGTITHTRGFVIFDAHTGNFLGDGAFD